MHLQFTTRRISCSSRANAGSSHRSAPTWRSAAPLRSAKLEAVSAAVKEEEEEQFSGPDVDVNPSDVAALLTTLTSETQIAQLQLKMGSFELNVRRSVQDDAASSPAAAAAAPAAAALSLPSFVSLAPEPQMSLSPLPYMSVDEPSALESVDEALVPCTAAKVGIFRRGKYAAGKKVGKGNAANVGDQVKKGQVLGCIEQLGTFVEIKAPQAGEVAAFQVDEGDPVEYQQVCVLIAPFFGVEEAGVTQHRL